MNNATIQLKIQQRLNKLSSNDFSNIQCWQVVEAFNKGMVAWLRRNIRGTNMYKEGAEQSIRRIDDLQVILKDGAAMNVTDKGDYFETDFNAWPADFFEWSKFNLFAISECCPDPVRMKCALVEEANVDEYLSDKNYRPNYEWGETFATIKGNKVQIYHDKKFQVSSFGISYFRQPRFIQIQNCKDPYIGQIPAVDVLCEFKDDLCELFIGEAAKIIAGDTNNDFQYQRNNKETEENN